MKNRGSTTILTNLVGLHSRNIHTKFEANPCSGLREEVEKLKKFILNDGNLSERVKRMKIISSGCDQEHGRNHLNRDI